MNIFKRIHAALSRDHTYQTTINQLMVSDQLTEMNITLHEYVPGTQTKIKSYWGNIKFKYKQTEEHSK